MAKAGDSYVVEIKQAHLEWGSYRHTNSRGVVYGEGYIHIPASVARNFEIYNSNYTKEGLGYNLYNCKCKDGLLKSILKSAGSRKKGDVYAKQFQGNGNLQVVGDWHVAYGAEVGDEVKVTWTSPTDIVIEFIKCV